MTLTKNEQYLFSLILEEFDRHNNYDGDSIVNIRADQAKQMSQLLDSKDKRYSKNKINTFQVADVFITKHLI